MSENSAAQRLQHLRELASTTTTDDYGRDRIAHLLEQKPGVPDVHCPRYVAVTEHTGDRLLICHDDPARLAQELGELSVGELPHSAEAVIDLNRGSRHAADTRAVISFTPPLPGAGAERAIVMRHGHPGALKHAADVLEEHAEGRPELTQTIDQLEDLLARWYAAAPAAS